MQSNDQAVAVKCTVSSRQTCREEASLTAHCTGAGCYEHYPDAYAITYWCESLPALSHHACCPCLTLSRALHRLRYATLAHCIFSWTRNRGCCSGRMFGAEAEQPTAWQSIARVSGRKNAHGSAELDSPIMSQPVMAPPSVYSDLLGFQGTNKDMNLILELRRLSALQTPISGSR